MKKVLDKDLKRKLTEVIGDGEVAHEIVELFRKLQDAGGLKVCQNITKTDVAYEEVG